ncbi:MAG: glycosyltransferase family 2 protein [Firmicutes bacterium]|nr:glycosyltransferase family 2 protein [Bacillota bacterium]
MKTCFLIVNYNDYENTNKLVSNIKDYKCIDKIIIVDNNSKLEEKELLKNISSAEVLYLEENKGYSSAINYGSKYLIDNLGDCYIIISNADIIINSEKDIKKLISNFDNNTAIVSPIINEHGIYNKGWKLPKPKHEILSNIPIVSKKIKKKLEYDLKEEITKVDVVSGCFFIIDSRVLESIDYLDENVFLYYEENILSVKIKKINKDILIDKTVEIIHNHSVTIDKNLKKIKKYKILKQSQFYFNKKYNNANILELILLKLTYYITYVLLYVYYIVLDILN